MRNAYSYLIPRIVQSLLLAWLAQSAHADSATEPISDSLPSHENSESETCDCPIEEVSGTGLVGILRDEGYGSVESPKEQIVRFKANGLPFVIIVNTSVITGLYSERVDLTVEEINHLNRQLLGVSVYPGSDDRLRIESYVLKLDGFTEVELQQFVQRLSRLPSLVARELQRYRSSSAK